MNARANNKTTEKSDIDAPADRDQAQQVFDNKETTEPEFYYSRHVNLTMRQLSILNFHLGYAMRYITKHIDTHNRHKADVSGLELELIELQKLRDLFTISDAKHEVTAPCKTMLITGMTFQQIDDALWKTINHFKEKAEAEHEIANRALKKQRLSSQRLHNAKAEAYASISNQIHTEFCPF